MKNKRSTKGGRVKARIMLIIVITTMTISMLFSTPGIAVDAEVDPGIENLMRSDFFLKLIGDNVSSLKVKENSDDRSFIGQFAFNALNIVNKEISFLRKEQGRFTNIDMQDQVEVVQNIVINPFKINDGSINKIDELVDIIGDPTDNLKKRILIYHTHTNEAYAEGNTGLESTVAAVGDALTTELEKLGFTVIHDKTVHDAADYNNAYVASRETVTKYLNKFGDFDLIIDLHRDGGPPKENVTATIEGNSIARLMLVTTKSDPRYTIHRANMDMIIGLANDIYPGLFRDGERSSLEYGSGQVYYSQDLSDNAILMEVGAQTNNLQEAKNSMVYMSKVIAAYLNSK